MAFSLRSNIPLVILILLFVVAEIIVWPAGDFPLNDDWCYLKSVKTLLEEGRFDIGMSMASLFAQALWGALFAKIFGLSNVVLRASTLVLAFFSLILFYRLSFRLSKNKLTAFILTALLVFNPLEFSAANTFMTDAPFLFSIVLVLYCAERYLATENRKWLLALCLASIYSVLIRQYGISAGMALGFFFIITKEKKRWLFLLPLVLSAIAYFLLSSYIKASRPEAGFVHVDSVLKNLNQDMLQKIAWKFSFLMAYTALFALPFSIPLTLHFFKIQNRLQLTFSFLLFVLFTWCCIKFIDHMPFGNVWGNLYLGPETFYETVVLGHGLQHVHSEFFGTLMLALTRFGLVFVNFVAASGIVILSAKFFRKNKPQAFKIFIFLFVLFTFLFVFVTQSTFDRYWLPLLPPMLLVFAHYNFTMKWVRGVSIFVLCVTFVFSVLATRDYFRWNDAKWRLIDRAVKTGIDPFSLNGGFEYFGYRFYDGPWWGAFTFNDSEGYIGFEKMENHLVRDMEVYHRCFPWKNDTLFFVIKKPSPN